MEFGWLVRVNDEALRSWYLKMVPCPTGLELWSSANSSQNLHETPIRDLGAWIIKLHGNATAGGELQACGCTSKHNFKDEGNQGITYILYQKQA